MRYFIYVDYQLKEVPEGVYDAWCELEREKYLLPEYSILIEGDQYSVETMYMGAIDKNEEPLPFVLFYFEDIYQITSDGISKTEDNDTIEYFGSFEAMVKRRDELIQAIESKARVT